MIVKRLGVCITILLEVLLTNNAIASDNENYEESFENIKSINVESVSGDLILTRSSDDKVHLNMESDYTPAQNFKYNIEPDNGVLKIRESFIGSTSGYSSWILEIPDQVDISFKSASGSLTIEYLEINVRSNVASGDIKITKCSGEFNISTASGDIEATGVSVRNESIFNSASGNVEIVLGDEVKGDLKISSVSGDALLDYHGNPVTGTVKIEIREDKGRVESELPIGYEETTWKVARNSQNSEEIGKEKSFLTKTITTSNEHPLILISTEIGTAILKK